MKYLISLTMLAGAMNMVAAGITSPSGNLRLDVDVDAAGVPVYTLDYKGKNIIAPSRLGLKADETAFADGFRIIGIDTVTVDRTWQPVWGEYSEIRDHFKELAVNLKADNPERLMTVRFRLFDDGLGFRYELPVQNGPNYLT
ncbi:MAG: glycoside hydrolase family 97 N-terminal domain-containing protein, partial [Muribaculaceae bacterium]|nr:glycoside hydrolase family 97 N-terminal domain-containing protein [Muribaculaceae bacterium]